MCFDNILRDSQESVSFATKCTTISTATLDYSLYYRLYSDWLKYAKSARNPKPSQNIVVGYLIFEFYRFLRIPLSFLFSNEKIDLPSELRKMR